MFHKVKSTAKSTFFYSFSNLAGKMSGIILLPIYTVYLPAEMFGLYALFEITFQVILAITGMGIRNALMRWYWEDNMSNLKKELFYSTFIFNLFVSVITMGVLFLFFNLLATYFFKTPISNHLKMIFIISTLIRLIVEMPMLLLRITHKAVEHTKHQLIQLISFVGCIAYFLIYMKMEILGIFWAFLISYGINFFMLIPYTIKNFKYQYQKGIIKEMLAFGTPLAISNVVNLVLSMSDRIVINIFGTLKNVGNYTLAFKISGIIDLMIVNAFMRSYTHVYYKGMNDSDSERFFAKSLTYLILILSFVSLGIVVFINDLVRLLSWGSGDYLDSIPLIPILTLGILFGGARSMLTLPLSKYKKTKIISIISITAGVINMAGNFAMVPVWGNMGAAISTVITQFITAIWSLYYARKVDKTPYELKKVGIIILTAVVFSFLSLTIHPHNIILRIALNSGILILWPVLLYYLNIFDAIEIERGKQAWKKWKNPSSWKNNLLKEVGKGGAKS